MDERNRDKKAKRAKRALNRLRRTLRKKETLEGDAAFSEWEEDFTQSLEQRLEKYGAAFADPQKGDRDEALSYRQAAKLREIEKKAAGKVRKPMKRGGFARKKPFAKTPGPDQCQDDAAAAEPQNPPPSGPPRLRIIAGGKTE